MAERAPSLQAGIVLEETVCQPSTVRFWSRGSGNSEGGMEQEKARDDRFGTGIDVRGAET